MDQTYHVGTVGKWFLWAIGAEKSDVNQKENFVSPGIFATLQQNKNTVSKINDPRKFKEEIHNFVLYKWWIWNSKLNIN